jgi:hypothetical protein
MMPRLTRTRCAAIVIACLSALPMAIAQNPLLPDAPDAPTPRVPTTLGEAFGSDTAGIRVAPPVGGTMRRPTGMSDEIVRWSNESEQWVFVVSRFNLPESIPLHIERDEKPIDPARPDGKAPEPQKTGFAMLAASQMPNDTPGKLYRFELLPIDAAEGAMLASSFKTIQNEPRLQQQAIIRKSDRMYYVLTFTTPRTSLQTPVEEDPLVRQAVQVFQQSVDGLKLIDQQQIKEDQTDRLIHTRALLVNWNEPRVLKALVPEQWTRIKRDGKDVGYSYIVEEPADELPRGGIIPVPKSSKPTGVRIGIRSRLLTTDGEQIDTENWYWLANDKRQESFSNQVVVTPKALQPGAKPPYTIERGSMTRTNKPVVADDRDRRGDRIIDSRDEYKLQVWTLSSKQADAPLQRELPPFYLPQTLGHLMPRLLPLTESQTYLFASYVSAERSVMLRYVDVLSARTVTIEDNTVLAVPVQERLGYEGDITTHYLTPEGQWIGSVNERNKVVTVPATQEQLQKIWKDANLTRPGDVKDPGK